MPTPPDEHAVRLIALICAITVVAGGWLGIAWLTQPDRVPAPPASEAFAPKMPIESPSQPAPDGRPATDQGVPPGGRPAPYADGGSVYKCRTGTRTIYSDSLCNADNTTVNLPPPSAGLSPQRSYAEQLAQIQAERSRSAAIQSQSIPARPAPSNASRCAAIDAAIKDIDDAARQPHQPSWADHLRQRRKTLMDERFSIGCNG